MASTTITGSDPATGNLTMSDHGNTNCKHGEVVTWVILPTSGVNQITAITPKPGNINVFAVGPAKLPGAAKNWQGRIKNAASLPIPTPPGFVEELYDIAWTDNNGNHHIFDPKIQVNS